MTQQNNQSVTATQSTESVAAGQKLIIYSILLYLITIGLQMVIGDIAGLLAIVVIIMSLIGVFRLASGLGYSIGAKIGLVVLLLLPIIGLITLLVLNSRATKVLKEAGYKVGLFGAKR